MDSAQGAAGRWDARTWSLPMGSVAGIRIRLHFFFLVLAIYQIIRGVTSSEAGEFTFSVALVLLLWLSVLLHELGHCVGCRLMGGRADEVLLWPLGGLAYTHPPHRPYEMLVTTLAGPLVNLAFCLLLLPILVLAGAETWSLLDPMNLDAWFEPYGVLVLAFKVNYWLVLFNLLLPIYPFDGGRVVQELLWFKVGYHQATAVSTTIGMFGAVLLAAGSVYLAGRQKDNDYFLLTMVAVYGFLQCIVTRRELEGEMIDNEFGYDFSQGFTSLERSMEVSKARRVSLRARFRDWWQHRRHENDAQLEVELDRILEKISLQGMDSLTRHERRTLWLASKKKRQAKL